MECSADVVLQVRDLDALHCCLERIRTLFNVRSEIVSLDDAGCRVPEPGLAGYPPPVGRSVRLKLWADTASKPSALKASKELLATACESVSAADALSAMRCGAFSSSGSVDSTAGGPGRPDSVRRRRTLESEDSSYDSDTENPPDTVGGTTTTVAAAGGSSSRQHEDVSRTVSETLGAEFAEYVTAGPQYASRLEFAVKLGYTEAQVQQALRRLGPQPAQNELLAELVRLGAREQQQPCGGGTTAAAASGPLAGVEGTTRSGDHHHSTSDDPLRPIVIDGSNVAMSHGNKEVFSCRGIQLAVEWFRARGHMDISVFVPSWRKEASRAETPIKDQEILLQLEKERLLFFTPSRNVGGKRMVCYEDRYILKMAAQTDGVVVSNDNYRDLVAESLDFKRVVEERLLMYTFVNDRFMPPDDPLGRHGPSLEAFLRKSGPPAAPFEGPPSCPYGKKCTYGNKCKYYHPERGNLPQKSVTERLAEQARLQLQEVKARSIKSSRDSSPGGELLKTKSLPPGGATEAVLPKKKLPLSRTKSSVPSTSLLGADLLEADGGGHLSVAKRLSDPDSGLGAFSLPKGSPVLSPGGASVSGDEALGSGGNLHRKLQRQLTLNPAYDPRLYQLRASQGLVPPPPAVSLAEAVRASSQESLQPHRALGRLASDSGLLAGAWGPLAGTQHPEVTRIASAPDSTRRSQQAAAMQRLSSTSDTRLDAFPLAGAAPPPLPAGPYPSYPGLSPHAAWGPLPPMGRPPPPHLEVVNPGAVPLDTASPRYRLYYHLSSIFPEEQVRAAMDLCPEETNPQKVCAAILAMFPKG